ncbi:MAG TPA: hypothetical protein VHU89_08945 [Acidobacteriaceae bacterium]|jgi:hypothetical protein|nr:hypothetical protein [Acidobacteriaceae bacterium]
MTRRRTKLSIAIVVVILVLLGGAIYLRKEAPPEAARLLPESDGIVYINLRPLRAATHFDQHPVAHSPEYQRFIDATGIEFERDLDNAAFALHRMNDPNGPNGSVAFSDAFVGHFDGRRLAAYLASIAASQETYAGRTIYNIPSDGRTVRVALLGYDIVAVSNYPSPEMIHSMIDRYRTAALPFAGSSLLARNYSKVPLLSVAWGIGQIALPLGNNGGARIFGLRLPLPVDAMFIASLSWIGKIHLRIEEIAPSDSAAADTTESMQTILVLVKSMENTAGAAGGPPAFDSNVQAFLNSIEVERHRNQAVLTASIPTALVQRMMNAPQDLKKMGVPDAGKTPLAPSP